MRTPGITMRQIRHTRRLHFEAGLSFARIARALGIAKSTAENPPSVGLRRAGGPSPVRCRWRWRLHRKSRCPRWGSLRRSSSCPRRHRRTAVSDQILVCHCRPPSAWNDVRLRVIVRRTERRSGSTARCARDARPLHGPAACPRGIGGSAAAGRMIDPVPRESQRTSVLPASSRPAPPPQFN